MKNLIIEWKHFDQNGETCRRCSQTGRNLKEVIKHLQKDVSSENIKLVFKETKLFKEEMRESNAIFIDGIPLEELVSDVSIGENTCHSCSNLIEQSYSCRCRTIKQNDNVSEEISKDIIEQAIIDRLKSKK